MIEFIKTAFSLKGRRGCMNTGFDVNKRKRQLIKENVDQVPMAARGRKLAKLSVLSVLGLRAALLIFEIIFCAVLNIKISIWSHLLFLPFLLIMYMVYDGNKSLVYIAMISAPVRLIYHFASVLPTISTGGINALTVVSLVVLIAQFAFSVFMSASTRCDVYFVAMQKVNLKLRSEMIGRK